MRYQILKFMSKHPLLMLEILILMPLFILAGDISETVENTIGVFTTIGEMVAFALWMAGILDGEVFFNKFMKKINITKYEKRYAKNEKILREIYEYKIQEIYEENCLINYNYAVRTYLCNKLNVDLQGLNKWFAFLREFPLELKKPIHKEILQKLYQATENSEKFYHSLDYDKTENSESNAEILINDLKCLCENAEKAIKSENELKSIFEEMMAEVDKKKNVKYLISYVNAELEKNAEFEETVKKLTRIQKLIPEDELPAKFKIILENMLVCSKEFENSNDECYQKEFKEFIIQINHYLDKILKGEEEASNMKSMATLKALKDFIS